MSSQSPRPEESLRVVSLPGDGVGPEVTRAAVQVLEACAKAAGRKLEMIELPIGGAAYDSDGDPLPERTESACKRAHAVLLGAVGGPQYDGLTPDKRPEKGLLRLRKALGVFANLRPVKIYPSLVDRAPIKAEYLRGTDMVVVRELLGGIYFGEPRGWDRETGKAFNTMIYSESEVIRVARIAFELARARGEAGGKKHVTSVDKANVLEVSRLWREVVSELQKSDYPDVELAHQYVDSAAMDLIKNPGRFDVVVTGNMFGDILTDEAAVLSGSIGLLPSASLGDGPGLYEPIHGSAPDIAGKGIATPIGTIASVASMLQSSLGLPEQAKRVEAAIDSVLQAGHYTADLGGDITTQKMGDLICQALEAQ
ncbi:MAG: 3-isopropylmalate dehydrogenase [Myxococcales bacterium]|nr:3-isopropylmalate dehydrogenase [Myxococcales bacterium]